MYLEERSNEKWTWDAEAKGKSEHILAFSVVFNCLKPLKPLVVKLHKQNQDIYMKYSMIDLVASDLKRYRENIDKEFKAWYNLATSILQSVDVQPSVPQLA